MPVQVPCFLYWWMMRPRLGMMSIIELITEPFGT